MFFMGKMFCMGKCRTTTPVDHAAIERFLLFCLSFCGLWCIIIIMIMLRKKHGSHLKDNTTVIFDKNMLESMSI